MLLIHTARMKRTNRRSQLNNKLCRQAKTQVAGKQQIFYVKKEKEIVCTFSLQKTKQRHQIPEIEKLEKKQKKNPPLNGRTADDRVS